MYFAVPDRLYLWGVIPLAIFFLAWVASRRRSALARFGVPALVTALGSNVSQRKRRWKMALWFVALVALVLARTRPLWGTQVMVKAQEGVEVMAVMFF
jgi:hypothetical protein